MTLSASFLVMTVSQRVSYIIWSMLTYVDQHPTEIWYQTPLRANKSTLGLSAFRT